MDSRSFSVIYLQTCWQDSLQNSLRKATTTRLFEQGVDLQLIKEATGHKSDAVMLYKKSNLKMKQKVSDMLNVLPLQMQAIRNREKVMMEGEGPRKG